MIGKNVSKPTESELEILQIIWKHGASTVKFVNGELNRNRKVGYTTTLKIMQIMTEKNLLTRQRNGRSHVYAAVDRASETRSVLLDRLLTGAFGGSVVKMVMHALGTHQPSSEEINQIRQLLEDYEGSDES